MKAFRKGKKELQSFGDGSDEEHKAEHLIESPTKGKFGFRSKSPKKKQQDKHSDEEVESPKKSKFGFGMKSPRKKHNPSDEEAESPKKSKFGFGSKSSKKKQASSDEEGEQSPKKSKFGFRSKSSKKQQHSDEEDDTRSSKMKSKDESDEEESKDSGDIPTSKKKLSKLGGFRKKSNDEDGNESDDNNRSKKKKKSKKGKAGNSSDDGDSDAEKKKDKKRKKSKKKKGIQENNTSDDDKRAKSDSDSDQNPIAGDGQLSPMRRAPRHPPTVNERRRERMIAEKQPELHIIGEIVGGTGFLPGGYSCKWSIDYGKTWHHIAGDRIGQTQVDYSTCLEDVLIWSHPLDLHFAVDSIQGWPRLLFEVWRVDDYGRTDVAGYGFTHVPTCGGSHVVSVSTWRPLGTPQEEIEAAFLGGTTQLMTDELVFTKAWAERCRLRTISSGTIALELDCLARYFPEEDIQL